MSILNRQVSAISRRQFLKASGLGAGGLIIGVSLPASLLASTDKASFEPNAFVYIAENGATTIHCGRCEMGQGISTALPAAVADELEADWAQVTVLQGDANKKFGPQATGGSNSINQMLEPMRKAGAAGREMLVAAAAQSWSLPVDKCYAKSHSVYNRVDDRSLSYGELAAAAGKLEVPENPTLKTKDQFKYIGKPLQRHDQADMVVGARVFGADKKVPGVKYAAIKHVPVLGGSVKSVDKSKALAMPGVIDVVVIPRFEIAYGSVGGVAVVADNTWVAEQALAELKIEFEAGDNASYNTTEYKKQLVRMSKRRPRLNLRRVRSTRLLIKLRSATREPTSVDTFHTHPWSRWPVLSGCRRTNARSGLQPRTRQESRKPWVSTWAVSRKISSSM